MSSKTSQNIWQTQGEDFLQLLSQSGSVLTSIDSSGTYNGSVIGAVSGTVTFPDNTTQTTAAQNNSIGTQLRRLSSVAKTSNPIINPPLTAPSAWAPGTAYAVGTVVSNGGNDYICYTGGTSAGSGGPTGTSAGQITDNNVVWYFYGLTVTTTSAVTAPTLTTTNTAPVGLTNIFKVVVNDNVFFYSGGVPYNQNSGLGYSFPAVSLPSNVSGNAAPHADNHALSVTFVTDAPKLAIGQANNNPPFRIIIDGQYLSLSATIGSDGANPCYNVLDFTSAGGRKARKITIEASSSWQFSRVIVDPLSKVWAPDTEDRIRAIFVGDSYTSGSSGGPYAGRADWPSEVGKYLGWCDPWNSGSGGTGYIANNSGNGFNFINRISDVTGNSPNVVVIMGGANDAGDGYTPTQIQAAVLSYLQAVRSALPGVPIIVTGIANDGGPTTTTINGENAVSAAVTQFGDSLTYFFPIATDPQGAWWTGTGNTGSPNGTGNNDVYIYTDGVHPTQSGIDYLAYRVANAIRNILPSIP